MNATPPTLLTFAPGFLKQPPAHMVRNAAITLAARNLAPEPLPNVLLVIHHLAAPK
jgi:hypothetical protein